MFRVGDVVILIDPLVEKLGSFHPMRCAFRIDRITTAFYGDNNRVIHYCIGIYGAEEHQLDFLEVEPLYA